MIFIGPVAQSGRASPLHASSERKFLADAKKGGGLGFESRRVHFTSFRVPLWDSNVLKNQKIFGINGLRPYEIPTGPFFEEKWSSRPASQRFALPTGPLIFNCVGLNAV